MANCISIWRQSTIEDTSHGVHGLFQPVSRRLNLNWLQRVEKDYGPYISQVG